MVDDFGACWKRCVCVKAFEELKHDEMKRLFTGGLNET